MAKKQTIIWTALPNGIVNGQLQFSVFVSPRLQTDEGLPRPTLSQFDDFKNWPDKIKNIKFTVQFEGQAPMDATRVGNAPEPELWSALFKDTTYVEPYKFNDYSKRPVISHPVLHLDSFVRSQYQSVATASPTRLPTRTIVLEKLAPISLYALPQATTSANHQGMVATKRLAGTPSTEQPREGQAAKPVQPSYRMARPVVIPQPLTNFIQTLHPTLQQNANRNIKMLVRQPYALKPSTVTAFQSVYQDLQQYKAIRPSPQLQPERDFLLVRMSSPSLPEKIEPIQPPEIDFHKIVSTLGNYPEIMKALGLVINLTVPLPAGLASSSTVKVVPGWASDSQPSSFNTDFSPKTAYSLDTGRSWFAPRPEKPDSDIIDGQLKLNDHQSYPVMSVDVDGSALKMANLADRLTSATLAESENPSTEGEHPMMLRMTPSNNNGGKAQVPSGSSAQAESGARAAQAQTNVGLPALRTGGLSVSRAGKAEWLVNIFARATVNNQAVEKNTPDQMTLYAEDVVRGYRVDIWDSETKSWNSLCRRVGTYNFFGANILRQYQDEGFVQLATTQSSVQPESGSDESQQDLYLHESMFDWKGWSLCAPRPGKVINPDGIPQPLNDPTDAQQRAPKDFQMVATFVPQPGSLPKLRFGRTYRVRARVVDLAGNSLAYDAPSSTDFSRATDPHPYNRFEPVVGPVAVLTKSLDGAKSPGESLYRPVIRSNFDKTTQEYAPAFGQLVSDSSYTDSTFRIVAPPKTSELMAERHGMFDLSTGAMKKDPTTYQLIVGKVDGSFALDPMTKNPISDKLEIPYLPDPLSRGMSMVMLDKDGGVAGTVPPVDFYPQGSDWPDARPFFVKVVEGEGKTSWGWDNSNRTLIVKLPKAEVAKFELSSYLGGGQAGSHNQSILGVWNWIEQAQPSNLTLMRTAVVQGRFWMLTPSREMVLVHAVQQPLVAPAFHQLSPNRHLGETFSYIVDDHAMRIDGKSTLKVEVEANWQEPIDDVNDPNGPRALDGSAHVYTRNLTQEDNEIFDPLQMAASSNQGTTGQGSSKSSSQKQEMRTFTLRQQNQSKQAPARQEQVAFAGQETFARQEYKAQPGIKLPNDVRLYRPPQYHVGFENFGYSWRHDFGDTKYRKIGYQAVATTRFREYFPAMEPDQLTRRSPVVQVDVPNSARPARPNVLYVVPTFAWERKDGVHFDGNTRPDISGTPISGISGYGATSKRMPGGLRIYLDRPWYSSGDGELLGVVVWPSVLQTPAGKSGVVVNYGTQPNAPHVVGGSQQQGTKQQSKMNLSRIVRMQQSGSLLPEALKPLVTQWGMDPIWESNPLPADLPTFGHFKNTAQIGLRLTLEELKGLQDPSADYYEVGVAAFKPEYDKDRGLWYCDVEIDAGQAYLPFIRLALVRYQPHSLPDAHLSHVVLADLAQLTPERTATITYNPNNPTRIDIVVAGLSYASTSAGKGPSLVEATVESNPTGGNDETAWIPVPNGTVVLQAKPLGIYSVWRYELHLNKLKVPKHQPLRLVIREFELLPTDMRNAQGQTQYSIGRPIAGRRLVYAEILKVPPIH